jgi:hypothetical protein
MFSPFSVSVPRLGRCSCEATSWVQLARTRSLSSLADPASAVQIRSVSALSALGARSSRTSSSPPTIGWSMTTRGGWQARTRLADQRYRNGALDVESSPHEPV